MFESVKAGVLDFLFAQYLKDKKSYVLGKTIEDLPRFRTLRKSTVGRRCRELAADGVINRVERKTPNGRVNMAWYQWKKPRKSIVWQGKPNNAVKTI